LRTGVRIVEAERPPDTLERLLIKVASGDATGFYYIIDGSRRRVTARPRSSTPKASAGTSSGH